MTGKISLTASMRNNLLSLQNISRQVSATQNKLATGNKVNSAIDNPSSYYTARALNNRADDLNALLDSMGQAISTIKAAATALETGASFLEQAAAVATQALETTSIPAKSYFEERVGENGTVVATAQELRDAVASGKGIICVYGKIDLGDISDIGGLQLKDNQKLVGIGYFGDFDTKTEKFSLISATVSVNGRSMIGSSTNSNTISDLSLKYTIHEVTGMVAAIHLAGSGLCCLSNLDIQSDCFNSQDISIARGSLIVSNNTKVKLSGKINIQSSGQLNSGIYINRGSADILSGAQIKVTTKGSKGQGICMYGDSIFNAAANSDINIVTQGTQAYGVYARNGIFNFNGRLSIETLSQSAHGIMLTSSGTVNINNDVGIKVHDNVSYVFFIDGQVRAGNVLNILSTANMFMEANNNFIYLQKHNADIAANSLQIKQGAQIGLKGSSGKTEKFIKAEKEYNNIYEGSVSLSLGFQEFLNDKENFTEISGSWPRAVISKQDEDNTFSQITLVSLWQILEQYDALIKDSSYKGVNLLQSERLNVNFNESRSASLNVQGRDMTSAALGLATLDWQTQGDIAQSLSEISAALKSIRSFSAELGNNYSIITSRQDFTENLINILTEGADKLTLADMNEESANMLALQTRQQLAVNSLSLASQASQSVLRLF